MSWTHWLPSKVTNVQATVSEGGNLTANTTYYVVVVAIDGMGTSRGTITNWGNNVMSPYSDEISFTTTSTARTVNLTWDKVYKRSGTVEVDGYCVLLSKVPNIATLPDNSQIKTGNYYDAYSTNSATITTNANYYYATVPNGIPYLACDGSNDESFELLYDYIKSQNDISFSAEKITSFSDMIIGYKFLGMIYIDCDSKKFTAHDLLIFIFGKIGTGYHNTYDFVNTNLYLFTCSHAYSSSVLGSPSSTSILKGCTLSSGMGKLSTGSGKNWCYSPGQFGAWQSPTYDTQEFVGNSFRISNNATVLSGLAHEKTILRRSDVQNGATCTTPESTVYQMLAGGGSRITFMNDRIWSPASDYRGWEYGSYLPEGTEYWQGANVTVGCFLDCYYKYNGVKGWNRIVSESPYYASGTLPLTSASMWKTIRVKVINKNGTPIENAQVSFLSDSRGTNLTHPIEVGNKYLQALTRQQDVNWDTNHTSITPTDNKQWFRQASTTANPDDGSVIWFKSEKIKLVKKLDDTGVSYGVRYDVEKGYDGTIPSYIYLSTPGNYYGLVAPEYHLTNASGEVYNPTLVWDLHINSVTKAYWDLETHISNGYITKTSFAPVTIRIKASGYRTINVKIPEDVLIDSGNKSLELVVNVETSSDINNLIAIRLDDNLAVTL